VDGLRPPLFIATKLEAFRGRGGGDVVTSHDLEDIVMVIDGRPELVEALPGFLLPDAASQARRQSIERRMKGLARL